MAPMVTFLDQRYIVWQVHIGFWIQHFDPD